MVVPNGIKYLLAQKLNQENLLIQIFFKKDFLNFRWPVCLFAYCCAFIIIRVFVLCVCKFVCVFMYGFYLLIESMRGIVLTLATPMLTAIIPLSM